MGKYSSHQTFPPFSWIHLHVMWCVLADDHHPPHGIIILFKLSSSHLKWKGRKTRREKYFHQVSQVSQVNQVNQVERKSSGKKERQTRQAEEYIVCQDKHHSFCSHLPLHLIPRQLSFFPLSYLTVFSPRSFHNSIEIPVSFSSLTQHTYTDNCWESRRKTERRRLSSWSILQWRVTGGCQWI